jgi:hypothetical protein
MWQLLCAALLPIRLENITDSVERFIQYLQRSESGSRERQIAVFTRKNLEYSG